jgi:hypothetical protein
MPIAIACTDPFLAKAAAVALRIGSRLADSDAFVFISHAENTP